MSPLISVIVPVYNGADTITATVESILAQTYEKLEVICVNDGSQDNTAAVLAALAEKYPRVTFINKPNEGVTRARLDGVKAAKGEYIGFVDADDLLDSDMYERLMSNVLQHGADISHCGYRLIFHDGITYFYNTKELRIQNTQKGVLDLLEGTKVEPGLWNKLFRRELFQVFFNESSIMDYSIRNNEDLLMNYVLFKQADTSVFEDFCPYQYIVRSSSASKGAINEHKLLDPAKAARIIYEDCCNELKATAANLYVTKLTYAATYYGQGADTIKAFRTGAQKELRNFIFTFLSYDVGVKKKLLTVLAAFCPKLYHRIHTLYRNK